MEQYKEIFMNCNYKGDSYRLYFADDLYIVAEILRNGGFYMYGFATKDEAIDFIDEQGANIDELRPQEPWAEAW